MASNEYFSSLPFISVNEPNSNLIVGEMNPGD